MIPQLIALRERVVALEEAKQPDPWPTIEALIARIEELEAAESARIATPVAPESAVTASGVPQEPGNATEAHSPQLADAALEYVGSWWSASLATAGEVAAALRMYRKVQGCKRNDDGVCVSVDAANWYETAAGLLAWLKEGEA